MILLTENVDITEPRRDLFQERGDLGFVRNIKNDGDETSTLLDTCSLVCSGTLFCYALQGIRSTCGENDIRTTLSVRTFERGCLTRVEDELPTLANNMAVALMIDRGELMIGAFG